MTRSSAEGGKARLIGWIPLTYTHALLWNVTLLMPPFEQEVIIQCSALHFLISSDTLQGDLSTHARTNEDTRKTLFFFGFCPWLFMSYLNATWMTQATYALIGQWIHFCFPGKAVLVSGRLEGSWPLERLTDNLLAFERASSPLQFLTRIPSFVSLWFYRS